MIQSIPPMIPRGRAASSHTKDIFFLFLRIFSFFRSICVVELQVKPTNLRVVTTGKGCRLFGLFGLSEMSKPNDTFQSSVFFFFFF